MRVDIGRVMILHRYGGLYSDLDVIPNRSSYAQTPFASCMVPGLSAKKLAGQVLEAAIEDIEFATMGWVDWFNNRRLHSTLDYMPPAEYETNYYATNLTSQPEMSTV